MSTTLPGRPLGGRPGRFTSEQRWEAKLGDSMGGTVSAPWCVEMVNRGWSVDASYDSYSMSTSRWGIPGQTPGSLEPTNDGSSSPHGRCCYKPHDTLMHTHTHNMFKHICFHIFPYMCTFLINCICAQIWLHGVIVNMLTEMKNKQLTMVQTARARWDLCFHSLHALQAG